MKKTTILILIGTLTSLSLQPLKAGDKEWAIVGKVLTGVAAAAVIGDAIAHSHVHPQPVPTPCVTPLPPRPPKVFIPPVPVYIPPTVNAPVRYRPRLKRQRVVIIEPAPIVVRQPRIRYRPRFSRPVRYVAPSPVICAAPY